MRRPIPLGQRSAREIKAQAEEYREMAENARTPEAKRSLETLAVRFAQLADQREAEQGQPQDERPAPTRPKPTA